MSSAKNLSFALAAAVVEGRWDTRGSASLADVGEDCYRHWTGGSCGLFLQPGWASSQADFPRFLLNGGRNGSVKTCRGGGQRLPYPSNVLALWHRISVLMWGGVAEPFFFQTIDYDERQSAEKIWANAQAAGFPFKLRFLNARGSSAAGTIYGGKKGEIDWKPGCMRHARLPLDHSLGEKRYGSFEHHSVLVSGTEEEKYQVCIKTISGKTILVWVSVNDTGETLNAKIAQREGYSRNLFYILHRGKVLKEDDRMRDCQIGKNSILHMMYRMRGGMPGNRGTAGPSSYKDAARSKGPQTYKDAARTKGPQTEATTNVQPSPYIVEKLDEIPSLEVKNPEVKELFNTLQTHALICRFNGYWPRSYDLHNWIYTNWTIDCQILLCSKGFFIVQFEKQEDCQKVITQGPWFWGRAGLFITPWFPEFDANSMVVTKMPVWVRLPNLPLPFWHHLVLEDIGNLLGTFIKRDPDRNDQGLFTYARICVEIDLSKGLPDRIHLQYEKLKWLQLLDYENTAFRCRFCHDTGHLQDTCPLAKRYPKKKKGTYTKGKTWQSDYAPQCNEDSEVEESDPEEQQEKEERVKNWQNPETLVERKSESKSVGKETPMEDGKSTVNSMADHIGEGSQTAIVTQKKVPDSGVKRGHESEKSDSDKEHPTNQKPEMVNGRQLVIATSSQGKWVEVKNKRKGKKGKIEDYYQH